MNVGSDGNDFGILGIFGSFTFRYGMNHQNLGSGSSCRLVFSKHFNLSPSPRKRRLVAGDTPRFAVPLTGFFPNLSGPKLSQPMKRDEKPMPLAKLCFLASDKTPRELKGLRIFRGKKMKMKMIIVHLQKIYG